jgi:hypothetical protein
MKRLVLCLTALLLCITVGAQSLEEIRAKASTGDAYFQYLLGWSYANGANGVSLDYNAAKPWFEKASENGYAAASYFLGWMYFYGEGVTKNDTEALKWFKKSESQGMSEAHAYAMVSSNRVVDTFDPSRPPILEITANSVKFVDPNGNNAIDAGEDSYISFQVTNKGKGPASRCIASALSADNVSGLILRSVDVPEIAAGKTKTIRIPITADMNIKDGKADLVIRVNEPHGFGTDPIELAVATKKFVAPKLEIVDYAITSGNVNTLKKKVPFDLQVLLQNVQHGNAEDVSVEISIPNNVILMKPDASKETFHNIAGGVSKSIVYPLIVNDDYKGNTIPVDIRIKEKYGKYAQSKHIDLQLNQSMAASKIEVKENAPEEQSFYIQIASLSSDVDKISSVATAKANNTFAVVIANESYNKEAGVPFAANDGKIFAEYCKNVLGLPEENVHLSVNATLNDMKHEIGWLSKVLETRKGKAKAIFYYAGHGIPDEASKNAYLLPVDGYGSDISTGYPLEQLYKDLGSVPSEKVTVFLDACFSGAKREGGMLASARGIALKANRGEPTGNMVVFSAAQGDETAYPYKKEGHGLFTYYLLHELKATKGDLTLKQLGDYITEKVSQQSIVINSKPQTPMVIPSKTVSGSWENWKLR